MTKKTIQFNPDYFTLTGKKNKKSTLSKRDKKIKPNATLVNTNKIKKQLLMKIKEFQSKKNKQLKQDENDDTQHDTQHDTDKLVNEFDDEFNKSLNFLQQLSSHGKNNKKSQDSIHNKSLKPRKLISDISVEYPLEQPQYSDNTIHVDTSDLLKPVVSNELNQDVKLKHHELTKQKNNDDDDRLQHELTINITPSKFKNEPPYSILKNGNKPTYRQWMKETQKIRHHSNSISKQPIVIENKPDIGITERKKHLESIKKQLHYKEHLAYNNKAPTIKTKKITRTIKRHLGKSGRTVSVLIKNRETRKKIQTEKAKLNKKNITEIKDYLRKHNLIKTGTQSPNYVLRKMYENCILSGEVNNKSSTVLFHNYINK